LSDYIEHDGTVWTAPTIPEFGSKFLSEQAVIDWMTTANERLGHNVVRVTPEGEKPWEELETIPLWQLKLVEVREEEIVGLTRPEFRALVREKLQEVGDDLLADWDKTYGK
jgi:hypothetical protein